MSDLKSVSLQKPEITNPIPYEKEKILIPRTDLLFLPPRPNATDLNQKKYMGVGPPKGRKESIGSIFSAEPGSGKTTMTENFVGATCDDISAYPENYTIQENDTFWSTIRKFGTLQDCLSYTNSFRLAVK